MLAQRNSKLTELPEPMQHWKCPILKKWPPRGHGSHCFALYILFSPWTRLLGTRGNTPTWTRGESRILHRKQITRVPSSDVWRCYVFKIACWNAYIANARRFVLCPINNCFARDAKFNVYSRYLNEFGLVISFEVIFNISVTYYTFNIYVLIFNIDLVINIITLR